MSLHYDYPPIGDDLDRVVSLAVFCQRNCISLTTLRRLVHAGEIDVIHLSPRRRGISLAEERRWREARTRRG